VPNVVGANYDDAKKALEDLGLKVTKTDDKSGAAAENTVTAQSIAEGTAVSPGTTIELAVAKDPGGGPDGADTDGTSTDGTLVDGG